MLLPLLLLLLLMLPFVIKIVIKIIMMMTNNSYQVRFFQLPASPCLWFSDQTFVGSTCRRQLEQFAPLYVLHNRFSVSSGDSSLEYNLQMFRIHRI